MLESGIKMKISKLEKKFVNSRKQAEKNIKIAEQLFSQIDLSNVEKVLEVGCGIGVVASYLAKKYKWNVTGVDLDSEQVERAKNDNIENEYLKFFEADVTKLPFENREFDMVLSFDVLHHIPNWDKAVDEISRVLKPEGFYVLNDITLLRFAARISKNWGVFAVDDITSHLKRNNFEIVYDEKPKINIFLRHFSTASKRI
jgi:ubiquinone/menaquinone biosynthesis C-methylase UbiE